MLDDGWTDRWMNPGQSHLLAPDPGQSKEAPWWQVGVWAQEELWLTPHPPPHGLGETTGGRLSLGLAPGSTPPSCVTLGQLCDLSELHAWQESEPRAPAGATPKGHCWSSKVGFWLSASSSNSRAHPARPQEAQARNSEPSCKGRQTRHRHQGPPGQGEVGRRPHRTWWRGSCRLRCRGGT